MLPPYPLPFRADKHVPRRSDVIVAAKPTIRAMHPLSREPGTPQALVHPALPLQSTDSAGRAWDFAAAWTMGLRRLKPDWRRCAAP